MRVFVQPAELCHLLFAATSIGLTFVFLHLFLSLLLLCEQVKYQYVRQTRVPKSLPQVLVVNCGLQASLPRSRRCCCSR